MDIENIFNEYDENYLNVLNEKLKNSEGFIIFGAGVLGKKIYYHLLKENFKIFCFADNNETLWEKNINGTPIISISEASKRFHSSTCIIAIWNPLYHYALIRNQLSNLNFVNTIHAAQIIQIYSKDLLPHYHFQNPNFYFENKKKIKEVFKLLKDDESKKQYLNQLNYRLKIDFDSIPKPDVKNQYFPPDLINLTKEEVFLDAGAYDGDTFFEFSNRVKNKFKKYIALEPDPQNFELIKLNLKNIENVVVEPYAVGIKHEFLKFNSTGGEGASINNNGDITVECVSIDEKYKIYHPTFLKFDIEGGELEALKGASKLIKELTPTIAICIYHRPEDIFEIPLWIYNINKNYTFHTRTHGNDGFEFVLYAIPIKK